MALVQKPFSDIITFTRASGGGRFNASGVYEWLGNDVPRLDYDPVTLQPLGLLIEEQRTNLLTYSTQIDSTTRDATTFPVTLTPNAAVGPDGAVSATRMVPTTANNAHGIFRSGETLSYTSGAAYSYAIHAKQAGYRYLQITFPAAAFGSSQYANFDLQLGVVGTVVGGTAKIEPTGNGFYRCSFSATASASGSAPSSSTTFVVQSASSGRVAAFAGDGTSGVYLWGDQTEAGAFPTSYIPTPATFISRASTATYFDSNGVLTTAAVNEARYNHRYIGGQWVPTGLMLEAAATRLNTVSTGATLLTPTRATYVADGTLFIDGVTPFRKLVEDTSTNSHFGLPAAVSVLANTTYTAQYVVKAAGRTKFRLAAESVVNWVGSNPIVTYDLVAKTATGSGGATGTVKELGSGNYLVTWTATTGAVGFSTDIYPFLLDNAGNASYTGDGVSGIYISGYQLEAGAFATSLIVGEGSQVTRAADVSSSAQVTRSADVASVNTLSPWYRQDEGTLFAEFLPNPAYPVAAKAIVFAALSDNSYSNRISLASSTGTAQLNFDIRSAGTDYRTIAGNLSQGVSKIAGAYKAAASSMASLNGSLVSGPGAPTLAALSKLNVGASHDGSAVINGHIRNISYYPRRLSNESLMQITSQ